VDIVNGEDLSAVIRNLSNAVDLEEVLATLDQELSQLIAYDSLSVLVADEDGLATAYSSRLEFQEIAGYQMRSGESVLANCVRGREPVLYRLNPDGPHPESAAMFPIPRMGKPGVLAVLVLQRSAEYAFTDVDLEILRRLAPRLSVAMSSPGRLLRRERLAGADPRSAMVGSRSLFERLDAELARARRSRATLGVVQCALEPSRRARQQQREDRDCVVEMAARELREQCREYDFSARTGDDLMLVLPGFRPEFFEEKRAVIERTLREAFQKAGMSWRVVIAAAFYPDDGGDTEDLLTVASHRVVLAKQLASLHASSTH